MTRRKKDITMGQKIRQHLSREVACPTCGATPGTFCHVPSMRRKRDEDGNPRTAYVGWLHHSRKAVSA